ncbi:tetratricopeptide repeat-containing sensor histidine kinase [Lunatibacter salilacus]|uniref:tetratricopeptide repeat-containing sensor histidine kinase n=1 Tax=Lunatibacter salilacus TaxID=2483804 RepID=UPI00131B8C6C|nr:tetratricopeptide repeat protein [Lunatibacter salilacus]
MTDRLTYCIYGLFFIVVGLTAKSKGFGQSSVDRLASEIEELFDNNAFEAAVPLLLQSLQMAKDSSDRRRILADLGYAHNQASQFEQSLTYYSYAADIALQMRDTLRSARFIRSVGYNYQHLGLHALALDKYYDALQLVKGKLKYASIEAEIYNSMGLHYQQLNNLDQGLRVLKEAQTIWVALGDSTSLGKILTNIAVCYDNLKLYDSALYYNNIALNIKKNKNEPVQLVSTLNNIAVNLINLGREEEALPYLEESYQLHQLLNDKEGLAISFKNLADYALRKKRYIQSEAYLDSAFHILRGINSKDYLVEALELRIKLYEQTAQFEKGLSTYKEFDNLKTELYLKEKFKVQELGNMYLLREKEFENEQVVTRANLLEVQSTQFKNTSILLGIIGLLALAFAIATSRNLRVQKRQSEYIRHQNTIIKGQQDELRHRTSNSLARTNGILNSIARKITDEEVRAKLLHASRILVTAASLERHLIGVENEKEVQLEEFIESLIDHQRQALQLEMRHIQIEFSCDPLLFLPVDQVISTAIILNEWITNSLKYGFESQDQGLISIRIYQETASLILDYMDNGKGISEKSHAGTGTRLNELFLRELKGSITTSSEGGTRHQLQFPMKAIKRHIINPNQP